MTQSYLYPRNNIALRPLWTHQQRTLDAVRQAIREGHKIRECDIIEGSGVAAPDNPTREVTRA